MNSLRYPQQPSNEDEFEEFCLALLKQAWNLPRLERFGRRGEKQYGVDLIDMSGAVPLIAVQCKHHNPNKTLPPSVLEAEVTKALIFPGDPIGRYVVLTTAKKGARTQEKVREINTAHLATGRFQVELLTWDDIQRLIDESPDAQQRLGIDTSKTVKQGALAAVADLQTTVQKQALEVGHGDLDEAKAHLEKGEPQIASMLLQRMRMRSWGDLTPYQRFRLCTMQADAYQRLARQSEAAKLLIEARSYNPDDENAIINEISALRLLRKTDEARQAAQVARVRFPESARAWASCIELAAASVEVEALIREVPLALADNIEVQIAIAAREDVGARAEDAARRAVALGPNEPNAWFALGSTILRAEVQKVNPDETGTPDAQSDERLRESIEAFSKVLALTHENDHVAFRVTVLLRRAVVSGLLDDDHAAAADIEQAARLLPDDVEVLLAQGRAAVDAGNHENAVNVLRRTVMRTGEDEPSFLLAISLWNKNGPGDRDEALTILARVARGSGRFAANAIEFAIEGYVWSARPADASSLLDEVADRVEPVLQAILRARLAVAAGDSAGAMAFADRAFVAPRSHATRHTETQLAKLLIRCGRYQDAVGILERVAVPGGDDEAGRLLVECALRLDRHDVVLRYCGETRVRGIFDPYLLEREIHILERYDSNAAAAVLLELLDRDPSDHRARVRLITIGFRLGRRELIQEHADRLPGVADVDPQEGATVVAILSELDRVEEAERFAYDLLRRYFSEHVAHRAFRDAALRAGRKEQTIEIPAVAGPGVAVCLAEGSNRRWYVLEDSLVPAAGVDDELAADAPLAKRIAGKKVGEEVVLSEGEGLRRAAVVTELLPKHVYRARDVSEQWQYRFPDEPEMWMIRIGNTGDAEVDFKPIFDMLRAKHERRTRVEEFYSENSIPVSAFADVLRKHEMQAIWHIAESDDLALRCCRGTADELQSAMDALDTATEVVLDATSLATLLMLDALPLLKDTGKRLLISESTLVSVRALGARLANDAEAEGLAGTDDDGKPTMRILDEQQRHALVSAIERVTNNLDEQFVMISGIELAGLDPQKREELVRVLGMSGLESALLASKPNRVLWTDDGIGALVARDRFGPRRVWTQSVLTWMVRQGRMSSDLHAKLSAKLIDAGYRFTSSNVATFIAAGRLSNWNPAQRPLKRVIEYLGWPEVRVADAVSFAVLVTREVYLEVTIPEKRREMVVHILDILGARSDITDKAIQAFDGQLGSAFGLNVIGAVDAHRTFEIWFKLWRKSRPIV